MEKDYLPPPPINLGEHPWSDPDDQFLGCLGRAITWVIVVIILIPAFLKIIGVIAWPWGVVAIATLCLWLLLMGIILVLFG